MPLDVVVSQDPARGRDIQRAVAKGDAVGHLETAGDQHDAIRLVIAVAIDDRVHLARLHRSHEHGALRTERHHARVLDVLSEHADLESSGNDPVGRLSRLLRGQRRGLCGEECGDNRKFHSHVLSRW